MTASGLTAYKSEASITLADGSTVLAMREGGIWRVEWESREWFGRSLVALVAELPGPGFGPSTDVLEQVLDALISEIDRPGLVDRSLRSQLTCHY